MADPGYSNNNNTTTLRVGTWNVHQFSDGNSEGTFNDIVALLCAANLDIIGLQEATGALLPELVRQLNHQNNTITQTQYQLACKFGGTALITRLPIVVDNDVSKPGKGRYCCCRVILSDVSGHNDKQPPQSFLSIINLHLNHRKETVRSQEIETIVQQFAKLNRALPDLWVGDFNALTATDYTTQEWKEIRNVRMRNHWELPVSDVTSTLTKQVGLTDVYTATVNRVGPHSTCRFGTRIDYIYYRTDNLTADLGWKVVSVEHTDCRKLSDHNLVVATWENDNKRNGRMQQGNMCDHDGSVNIF